MSETMFITIDSKMQYFHVYIKYTNKQGKEAFALTYNLSKEFIKERIATPFMKNKTFFVGGRVYDSSNTEEITIFISEDNFEELILPDGKSPVGHDVGYISHCFIGKQVKGVDVCTDYFITSPPEEKEKPIKKLGKKEKLFQLATDLMDSATFLGLDTNWSLATCALQLQEVAITQVAKRAEIKLDKANVEKVLNKKIESLSFNNQYEAFSKLVLALFDVEMPILTTHLRKMRAKVLHEGYNPKPEETESIANFTIGLLRRLKDIR